MTTHKDLPSGSQKWAAEVTSDKQRILQLEAIVRRMANDFGLDYANPDRGLNTGTTPSIANPVMLKLPSLKDLDVRDAQDGDLLTFDGKRGVWTARAHDTVMLPKTFPEGDPDSYYTPPEPEPETGVWSSTTAHTNYITNPSFETGFTGWVIQDDWYLDNFTNVAKGISWVDGGKSGSKSMSVTLGTSDMEEVNWISFPNIPVDSGLPPFQISVRQAAFREGLGINAYVSVYLHDAGGTVLAGGTSEETSASLGDLEWHTVHQNAPYLPAYPTAASATVIVRFGANWEGELIDNVEVLVDCFAESTLWEYFDGDGGESSEYTYEWAGTPHASESHAITTRQINVPEVITLGEEFTVSGRGFPAGASVDVYEEEWYSTNSLVTADSEGNFTTTLTVPANTDPEVGPVAGPGKIEAYQSGTGFAPFVSVTFV
jgi:hypothetical protein